MDPIETDRLLLDALVDARRDDFVRLTADPRVVRHIGDGATWARYRADEVFDRQCDHWNQHGFGWRSVVEKESDEWIGFVGLNHVGPEAVEIEDKNEVEIGWWLDPQYWSRGFATEAAFAIRDEGFERVGLERIIGRYQPANVASGRIMETLGMRLRREAMGRHGETVRIYALDRSDWLIRHRP